MALAVLAVGASGLLRAEGALPPLPEFEFHAPPPVLISAEAEAGLVLEGIALPTERAGGLRPGDRITALVTLAKGSALTQWLIEVSGAELNEKEKQLPPLRTLTLFTNTGTEVFLGRTRAALKVRVLGPYERDSAKNAKEEQGRIMVNADYLGLGLDRGCESVISVNAAKIKDPTLPPFAWTARMKAFSADEAAAGRKLAAPLGLTPERERALVGANPALHEFFNLISRTPGLQDILKEVIDVPWWTIIKRGGDAPVGIMPQFRFAEEISAEAFHLGGGRKAYALPFQLSIGGKPALVGKLAVTSARPPLMPCAGIVGVSAWAPDGKGPRVMLQVLSARLGEARLGAP